MKYSKDKKVFFNDKYHTYSIGNKKLMSVTKYISQFKIPFDSDRIAGKYAKKHKLIKSEVLKMWRDKGSKAATMGTFIHKIFEDFILGNELDVNKDYPKYDTAKKIIVDLFLSNKLQPIETEYIVYNNKYAGQVDCIARDTNSNYYILDWKTNEKINFSNKWQSMTGKYSHLDDCSYNHYSIQLSMYKSMCKEYDIKDCFIVHLKENSYELIKSLDIKGSEV